MSTLAPAHAFAEPTSPAEAPAAVHCAHCTLPVPAGLIDPEADEQFCCEGCRAVRQTIVGCGLADYYRLRDAAGDADAAPAAPSGGKFESFDSPAFAALYVNAVGDHRQTDLVLEGLTCGACVWLIEKMPRVLDGVIEARLSLRDARLRVTWDPERIALSKIAGLLDRFGYPPHAAKGVTRQTLQRRRERTMLIDIGVAFALMGNLMLIAAALYSGWVSHIDETMTRFLRWLATAIGVTSLAWPGRCFFVNAWRSIRNRATNLDLPIAIALVAGGIAGVVNVVVDRSDMYFDSLSMLVFLLLVGRYVQYRQQRRADASVELLFDLMPSTVHVWRDDAFVDLPGEALAVGDRVQVRPGELIPGDGVVIRGRSMLDLALLTGESKPATVAEGDVVFGGAMNRDATIEVRVEQVGRETRVGRLMELVEQGLAEKPQAMRFADQIGRHFIPAVCLASLGTFVYWARFDLSAAIDHSIAMLIVTCPCILGLATPLTMAVSIGRLARRQILVKSAAALERLADVRTILFDKTGTLTHGGLRVVEYVGDPSWQPAIAAIESTLTHPVARALTEAYAHEATAFMPKNIRAIHASGVRAEVDGKDLLIGSPDLMRREGIPLGDFDTPSDQTTVFVAADRAIVAAIRFGDELKPDAGPALAALRERGIEIAVISGDAPSVVARTGQALGLPPDVVVGGVTPERKLQLIRDFQKAGPVAMAGDGVNDAAALAAADVGFAVRGGAEASLAAADVYVASPRVQAIADVVETACRTMRVVRRNFAITLFYNLVAAVLAATGKMNPLIAAILMPVSSATTLGFAVWAVRGRGRRS